MLSLKRGISKSNDTKGAVDGVVSSIKQNNVKLVMFFASPKYDFALISKFMKEAFESAEVIGCTTAGEIGPQGFSEETLVAMSIAADDFTVATAVMKDIKTKAILSKNDIMGAFKKTGMDLNDPHLKEKGFGILLIDGLQAAEEKVLTVINSIFNDFNIVGGSAADGMNFKKVYVSVNGEVFENAAVVTFVKTSNKFQIYKENIYIPTDIEFKATKVDMETRIVYEFNGRPAAEEYAKALGLPVSELTSKNFSSNPVGRQFGDSIWITSPFQILEGGAIQFYAQIMPNSIVKMLKPVETIEEAKRTAEFIKTKLPSVKGVISFNCVARYLQFKGEHSLGPIYNELSKLGEVIGFNCYGEQYGKQHINQTLTLIALGE